MSGRTSYSTGFEPDASTFGTVRETLLSWFKAHGRELPWRVLVSEVMLQQIQVSCAIPFYEALLARFPTPNALAQAPLAETIKVWGNLGRYKRMVNLHRAARILAEEHGGEVPSDPAALVKLPGIGPDTAGAVACFAYEQDVLPRPRITSGSDACPQWIRIKAGSRALSREGIFRSLGAVRRVLFGDRSRPPRPRRDPGEPVLFQALHDAKEPGQVLLAETLAQAFVQFAHEERGRVSNGYPRRSIGSPKCGIWLEWRGRRLILEAGAVARR